MNGLFSVKNHYEKKDENCVNQSANSDRVLNTNGLILLTG